MRCSFKVLLLAFLATLFRHSAEVELTTKANGIIGEIRKLLIQEKENTVNKTNIPEQNIFGEIISFLNCGPFPLSPNSHLQYSLDFATKNFRLFQTCDRYYQTDKKVESLQIQCKYKNWIFNEIGCEKVTCPLLTPPHMGYISTNANTFNTTVYFWCSRGFSINGTDKLFCEENGLWNLPPPICHVSYCRSIPPPRYGSVSSQEEIAVNQTIEFSCQSEYSLIGDAVLRCLEDGRWNTTAPVCKKMCAVPNITSQSEGVRSIPGFKELSIGSLLQQGQRVIFSCKPGYAVSSSGLSTCTGETWRPPITCRKMCAAIEITNGKYNLSKDYSTIEYSCLSGYQLIGRQKLTCMSNVTWDSEAPICTKMCTLSKRKDVLSFRQKATYEIIPFGTQIINGTQVYPICRYNTSMGSVVECINGELSPTSCKDPRVRLSRGYLQIFDNQRWNNICLPTFETCSVFGYKEPTIGQECSPCSTIDLDAYRKTSRIVWQTQETHIYQRYDCIKCPFDIFT